MERLMTLELIYLNQTSACQSCDANELHETSLASIDCQSQELVVFQRAFRSSVRMYHRDLLQ